MRVRIAVAISEADASGDMTWSVGGYEEASDESAAEEAERRLGEAGWATDRIVWIEADIPPPVPVRGRVAER